MAGFQPKHKRQNKGGRRSIPSEELQAGGLIQGAGSGVSDSIQAEVPNGGFIMPADSTEKLGAESLGGLGFHGGVQANVSDGEFVLPPEQVHAVGAQVLGQMKDATHTTVNQPQEEDGELFFANGGLVDDELKRQQRNSTFFSDSKGNTTRGAMPTTPSTPALTQQPSPTSQAQASQGKPFTQTNDYYRTRANQKADSAKWEAERASKEAARNSARTAAPASAPQTKGFFGGVKNLAKQGIKKLGPVAALYAAAQDNKGYDDAYSTYATRFGLEEPKYDGSIGDMLHAARLQTQGFASDFLNNASFGLLDNIMVDKQANTDPIPLATTATGAFAGNKFPELFGKGLDKGLKKLSRNAYRGNFGEKLLGNKAVKGAGTVTGGLTGYATGKAGVDAYNEMQEQEAQSLQQPNELGIEHEQQATQATQEEQPQAAGFRPQARMVNGVPTFDDTNVTPEMRADLVARSNANNDLANNVASLSPQSQAQVSSALQAAAARGDWDAVQRHYANQGQTFNGQGFQPRQNRNVILKDPSRTPSNSELMQARLQNASDNKAMKKRALDQQAQLGFSKLDIEQALAQPQLAQSGILQSLYEQYTNAETPEQQNAVLAQIRALQGKGEGRTNPRDRFMTVGGGQEWDAEAGAMRNVPQQLFDAETQQFVGEDGGSQSPNTPPPNHIDALKKDRSLASKFDEIYGQGAAQQILGSL